jgi:dolichyl-phosphate-mannose-protein mannosyltransferase
METAGFVLGVLCGVGLFAIFALALALAINPFIGERDFTTAMIVLAAVVIVKLALLRILPGEPVDLSQFEMWARSMAQLGPTRIYDPAFACKYTPAYLYALWAAGAWAPRSEAGLRIFVESLCVICDLLFAVSAYVAVRRVAPARFALPTTIVLALNPAIIYTSTVWGQNDSAIVFAVLLSVLMAMDSRYGLAWAIAIVGALIKLQGLIALPILAWWTLINGRPADWLKSASAGLAAAIIVFAPFQLGHPWHFAFDVINSSAGFFPWASMNAFNLLLAWGGLLASDSSRIIGPVSFMMFGDALFGVVLVFAGWLVWRRPTQWVLMFAIFVAYLGMFDFMPRMHERYLYYAVALLAPLMFSSWETSAIYITLTTTSLLNMAYVFFNLVRIRGIVEGHLIVGPFGQLIIAVINVTAFALVANYGISVARDNNLEPFATTEPTTTAA